MKDVYGNSLYYSYNFFRSLRLCPSKFFLKYLFIYLAAMDLSCSMRDL